MPGKGGLASGIIVAGFGCGSLIFNQVQSKLINPNNIPAVVDPTDPNHGKYFPVEVAQNVPRVFLILAGIYFVMQLIGYLLLVEPSKDEMETLKEKHLPIGVENKSECSHRASRVARATGFTPRELKQPVDATPRGIHAVTVGGQTVDHPYKPNEAMRTAKFWEIWGTFLMVGLTTTFMSSYWKPFGQSFITNDKFLAWVGSVSSVCNGLFRPVWGTLVGVSGERDA